MALRDYQQAAHDAIVSWVRKSKEPCVVEAPTGSGKSHIIAAVAETLTTISQGKHVLCLAPSAELVTQNREKYLATGNPASIYSASAGQKCLKHPVVFATPGTFKGKARTIGGKFCAVVLDEAHRITPTVKGIIADMQSANPNLRVIGLSATPYRLGSGLIYQIDENGKAYGPDQAVNPYFAARVYRITARELLDRGFLTRPVIGHINTENYETLHLELNSRGQFDAKDVDRAFIGHGRKTAMIVADVVRQARDRTGVMFFAATVAHAHEVLESLPPSLSAIITGETKKDERAAIINQFKAQKIKYLVNVDVLTTGFDADHVDVIALLRATESVSLLQQIIGRGLRIRDGKDDCLVLDYAQNIERHCPDGDLFNPQIKTHIAKGDGSTIDVKCPACKTALSFSARPNDDGYDIDEYGYFSLYGQQIETDHGPMPAHYGRRCYGLIPIGRGEMEQCAYRWTSKPCPECNEPNDIAARYCVACKAELVDPNDKLIADFKAAKKDPERVQTDRLVSYSVKDTVTQSGRECKVVDFDTEYRNFRVWYMPERREWASFLNATNGGTTKPESITYRKEPGKIFYRVLAFGLPIDTPESIAA
jgi:DNA repair protein RadD